MACRAWLDGRAVDPRSGGGGISALFERPPWQSAAPDTALRRLTPDISAVADTNTGA